jgi:tetratricopeptide (TPR) repeat protein
VTGANSRGARSGAPVAQAFAAAAVALALTARAHVALPRTDETAAAHVVSARFFSTRGEYAAAVDHYKVAVELIGGRDHSEDDQLIELLTELAQAQWRAASRAEAIESLHRAVIIVRRASGLYDERQRSLLLRLVDWRSDAGDLDGAAEDLQYLESLALDDAPASARGDALALIADWRCRIGRFEAGRRTYRTALDILGHRAEAAVLLRALLAAPRCCLNELAAEGVSAGAGVFEGYRGVIQRSPRLATDSPAFRFHSARRLRAEGEQALVRAVQLAEHASLPEERLAILLLAGDWFQMKDHTRAARRYYERAAALASSLGPDHALSAPVLLFYPHPPEALRHKGEANVKERLIEVVLTVRADGRVDSERVVVREAGKTAADETLLALQLARFRPRMVDGRPVDSEGVRHRQVFFERGD